MGQPAQQLLKWARQGQLAQENLAPALAISEALPNQTQGVQFLQKLLLVFGVLLFCSGVIFFFAYNWADLSRFEKFAIAQGAFALTLGSLLFTDFSRISGQSAIFASGLLLGALLALFGQTYQTGADTFQLFLTWALMLIPLAIIARSAALWLLIAGLLALTSYLYFSLHWFSVLFFSSQETFLWLLFVQAIIWFLSFALFAQRQPQQLILKVGVQTFSLFVILLPTILLAEEIGLYDFRVNYFISLIIWGVVLAGMYYYYRIRTVNLFILSCLALSIIIIIFAILVDIFDFDTGTLIIYAALLTLFTSCAVIWLRRVAKDARHV